MDTEITKGNMTSTEYAFNFIEFDEIEFLTTLLDETKEKEFFALYRKESVN